MTQPRDDRGRFAPKFGGLLAAGVIGTAAAVGVGAQAGGTGAGAGAVSSSEIPTLSVQERSTRAKQRSNRTRRSLSTHGLQQTIKAERDSESVTADAYGQVREFLETHQCQAIYRTLLEVRDDGVAILVAVAWVDMARMEDATALKALVDRPGTGNITQLPPPGRGQAISLDDAVYASQQRGTLIAIAEAEPEAVTASERLLKTVADQTAVSAADSR